MKSSRRNDRRRSDDTKRDTQSDPRRPATPTMNGPRPDMPSEFIDLSTEAFREAFPDLARPTAPRPSQPSRSPAPKRRDKDKG
jgi:hypothetical protein